MKIKSDKTRDYDIIAGFAGLIVGIIFILAHFFRMQNEYLVTLGTVLIITCSFYLLLRKQLLNLDIKEKIVGNGHYFYLVNIIFLIFTGASIYSLHFEADYRPVSYFIFSSLATGVVAVEIILFPTAKKQIYSILWKILVLALSLRATEYFSFPGLVGIDPWDHYAMIRDLLSQGHMPQSYLNLQKPDLYLNYPLFHLYTGIISNIGGLSIKDAMFFAGAVPEILSIVFVFLIGRELIGTKTALLATLLISFSDFAVTWGSQIIAMTLGVAIFSLVIYLIISRKNIMNSRLILAITIVSFAAIILTHTVTAFVLFITLAALFIMVRIYRFCFGSHFEVKYGSNTFLLFFTVSMFSWWIFVAYGGRSFLDAIVVGLRDSLTMQAALLDRPASIVGTSNLLESILDILGFSILFGLGVLGILHWLSNKYKNVDKISLIGVISLLFIIPFSFSLFGIRNVMPYRWFVFMYIPFTIAAAFGIVKLLSLLKKERLQMLGIFAVTCVISFFMITNTQTNVDNLIYKKNNALRLTYSTQEMTAAKTISSSYDGLLIYDGYYVLPFVYFYDYKAQTDALRQSWIDDQLPSGLFIWREEMNTRTVYINREGDLGYGFVKLKDGFEQTVDDTRLLVYITPQVRAYYAR